jgi:RHS repeat-associated protein
MAVASSAPAAAQSPGGGGVTAVAEYYGYDATGSVRVVLDASGTPTGQGTYTPFGQETYDSKGLPSQRFTGQERDGEAGLDHFEARSYQSRTGRLASVDPEWGDALGNPQRWNRYSYALNNPISFSDPTGRDPINLFKGEKPAIGRYPDLEFAPGGWGSRLDLFGFGTYEAEALDLRLSWLWEQSQLQGQNTSSQIQEKADDPKPDDNGCEQQLGGALCKDERFKHICDEEPEACGVRIAGIPRFPIAQTAFIVSQVLAKIGTNSAINEYRLHMVEEAEALYPKLLAQTAMQDHHIFPKYMGGALEGLTVPLEAPYHQVITNAFRDAWAYGQGIAPTLEQAKQIMLDVYSKLPLP